VDLRGAADTFTDKLQRLAFDGNTGWNLYDHHHRHFGIANAFCNDNANGELSLKNGKCSTLRSTSTSAIRNPQAGTAPPTVAVGGRGDIAGAKPAIGGWKRR